MKDEMKERLAALLSADDPAARRRAAEELAESTGFAPIAALAAALRDGNKGVRDAALRSLSKIGNENVARAAVEYIADENITTRNLAADLLMKLKDHSVGALVPYLYDADQDVRKFAVDILGLIGNAEAINHIILLLDDRDENVVVSAAEALGNIRAKQAIPHLTRVFELHEYAQVPVAEALGKIGDRTAADFLLKHFTAMVGDRESDPLVLYAIVESLSLAGYDDAIPELQSNIPCVVGRLRHALLHAIIRIAGRCNHPLESLLNYQNDLIEALHNDDMAIQVSAARVLSGMKGYEVSAAMLEVVAASEELDCVLIPALEQRDDTFRTIVELLEQEKIQPTKEVVALLGRISSKIDYQEIPKELLDQASNYLERALTVVKQSWTGANEETRAAIVDTLSRLDGDHAVEFLAAITDDPDPWFRIHIIELLAPLEDRRIPDFIARFLNDTDEMVREVAASTLEAKGFSFGTAEIN